MVVPADVGKEWMSMSHSTDKVVMSELQDFTIAQAVEWVAQEAGKHETSEAISRHIAVVEARIAPLGGVGSVGSDFEVNRLAHHKLIELLTAKLASIEAVHFEAAA